MFYFQRPDIFMLIKFRRLFGGEKVGSEIRQMLRVLTGEAYK